jgi:predicted RNA-binding Zn-ribbon protein involved in translation (DUF1610 family)
MSCTSFYLPTKMGKEPDNKDMKTCDECGSKYYSSTSRMAHLCPECSHILYGYENCNHQFENGRCIKCYWDGSRSEYIKKLISK